MGIVLGDRMASSSPDPNDRPKLLDRLKEKLDQAVGGRGDEPDRADAAAAGREDDPRVGLVAGADGDGPEEIPDASEDLDADVEAILRSVKR